MVSRVPEGLGFGESQGFNPDVGAMGVDVFRVVGEKMVELTDYSDTGKTQRSLDPYPGRSGSQRIEQHAHRLGGIDNHLGNPGGDILLQSPPNVLSIAHQPRRRNEPALNN